MRTSHRLPTGSFSEGEKNKLKTKENKMKTFSPAPQSTSLSLPPFICIFCFIFFRNNHCLLKVSSVEGKLVTSLEGKK